MSLLDFGRLRSRVASKETKRKIEVVLFSKSDDTFKVHVSTSIEEDEKTKKRKEFLVSRGPNGDIGEIVSDGDTLYVCVGKEEREPRMSNNVRAAMGGVFKTIPNHTEVSILESEYAEEAAYAFVIGSYVYDFMKEKKCDKKCFLNAPGHERAVELAHAQNFARFLGDTPANMLTPTRFTEYAREFLEQENSGDDTTANLSVEVYDKSYMEQKGMDLLLSVSQGSREEPRLVKVRYQGRNTGDPDVALVGKGVTFDSGGISIKPSAKMAKMKHDMMGAATLLATVKLAATFKVKCNITAVFPLVENMPSSSATKPGDVFKSLSGKTVEVDNTDAEGRLILADAMTFAQQDRPKYLIDAATLTGAMVVALGSVYVGYFCNDEEMASIIEAAGRESGEMLWRMPLSPYYRESLESHVADIVNVSGPEGGSAKAAAFLEEFVDRGTKWAHFDIAGMIDSSFNSSLYGSHATGRPVLAFIRLMENIADRISRIDQKNRTDE